MPSKNTKARRRSGSKKKDNTPAAKDDGTRWLVVRHGTPVYPSHTGTTRDQAERLADGLLEPAEILQVAQP